MHSIIKVNQTDTALSQAKEHEKLVTAIASDLGSDMSNFAKCHKDVDMTCERRGEATYVIFQDSSCLRITDGGSSVTIDNT